MNHLESAAQWGSCRRMYDWRDEAKMMLALRQSRVRVCVGTRAELGGSDEVSQESRVEANLVYHRSGSRVEVWRILVL